MLQRAPAAQRPLFIGSEIYRSSTYGRRHPLAIPRVSTVMDLSRALGWLDDDVYLDSPRATPEELARFHAPDYVAAVQAAEATQRVGDDVRERTNLGRLENPVFGEMFRRPATAVGGSLAAADRLVEAWRAGAPATVYNPAGGTHHGRPDRASGFCYFNDPVLGILRLLDGGLTRVFYADFDAHHGDGVEAAFADDDRVLTCSVHEAGRWPMQGTESAQGPTFRNVAVPPGFHDDELAAVVAEVVLPLADAFAPEAVVIQGGADALAEDPLSKLSLSNRALWHAVQQTRAVAPLALVLGGGGYNPWFVARAWTGVWAGLNGIEVPARLPAPGEAVLRALRWRRAAGRNPPDHWFTTLADAPRGGPVRDEVRRAIAAAAP